MLANHKGECKVYWCSWHRLLAANPMFFFSVFTLDPFEIVEKRNIPFCRELSFIVRFPDLMLWPDYLLGMPMVRWARRAPTMVPMRSLDYVQCLNFCIMLTPTTGVFGKELVQLETLPWTLPHGRRPRRSSDSTLFGPLDHPWQLPDVAYRLLPRLPIWEQHGGASKPSCRIIDDCLHGGQNDPVGLRTPTDLRTRTLGLH